MEVKLRKRNTRKADAVPTDLAVDSMVGFSYSEMSYSRVTIAQRD